MKRVFILSSHPLLGKGIESLLRAQEDTEVVGREADLDKAVERIKALQPDVIVVACDDAEKNRSIMTTMRILQESLRTCVVGLSLHDNMVAIYHKEERTVQRLEDFVEAIHGEKAVHD